jgi:hypothetical protein
MKGRMASYRSNSSQREYSSEDEEVEEEEEENVSEDHMKQQEQRTDHNWRMMTNQGTHRSTMVRNGEEDDSGTMWRATTQDLASFQLATDRSGHSLNTEGEMGMVKRFICKTLFKRVKFVTKLGMCDADSPIAEKIRKRQNWEFDASWVAKWEKEIKPAVRDLLGDKRSAVNQAVQNSIKKGTLILVRKNAAW